MQPVQFSTYHSGSLERAKRRVVEGNHFVEILESAGQEPWLSDADKQALREKLSLTMNLVAAANYAACTRDENLVSA